LDTLSKNAVGQRKVDRRFCFIALFADFRYIACWFRSKKDHSVVVAKKPIALVVGGSSGLGLEIARSLHASNDVHITGRNPVGDFPFHYFNMGTQLLGKATQHLISQFGFIDTLAIAAGYLQKGTIDQLSPDAIVAMAQTNIIGPALLVREVLLQQEILPTFVVVTSTSEWVPRRDEPIYAATKRGMAGLAESLAEDPRIAKTLVVAPSKMATPFWMREGNDPSGGLDPAWVAERSVVQLKEEFYYRHVKILRDPARVEISVNKTARA
jgi:NAD(P)-dependent dehydrogenase (short-subunit alcohol dehydrogenase family)